MRISVLAAALAVSMPVCAQGAQIPIPAFNRTFSSSLTRGMFFQAPVPFFIVGAQVPDETNSGTQNLEIYVFPDASSPGGPPAYSATYTPTVSELKYTAYGVPQTGVPLVTGAIPVSPGDWVVVLGACGTGATMHNSYGPTGQFTSSVLGAPITLSRCGTQTSINTNNGPNALWSEVAFEPGRVELYVAANTNFQQPPELVAVAEQTPFAGTLSTSNAAFSTGDFLRWNFNDPANNNAGLLIFNALNFGTNGLPPIGITAQVPGLVQVWPGSMPMGLVDVIGPTVIGSPDTIGQVPPGLFSTGDTIRMQGVVLDMRVQTATTLPVNPTLNTIVFTHN